MKVATVGSNAIKEVVASNIAGYEETITVCV
jgi:hypothetical protein